MILRTGVDLVEIARIRRSLKNPRFLQRFFGRQERIWLEEKNCPAQSVAASFCAKEAFAKAMGIGIRNFALKEVELLRDELGAPYFHLTGNAKKLASEKKLAFSVSISHTKEHALAFVVAIGQ